MSEGISFKSYVTKRILQAIPLVFIIIILTFTIIHLAPGDPVYILVGEATVSDEYLEMVRIRMGLDKSLPEQLLIYITSFMSGDLGYSFFWNQPVLDLILERLPATLLLMLSSIIIGTGIGILLGVYSANRPHSLLDYSLTTISLAGYSIPRFWLALVVLLVFGLWLDLFPISGMTSVGSEISGLGYITDVLWHAILPILALSTRFTALITRLVRTSMLEALSQDFIITAKSKGLKQNVVLFKHALRNALLPVITVVGMNFGFMFSGSVLVETVFSWPGLGRLLYDAFYTRDYPVIMGMFVFVSIIVIIVNLITDITYSFVDPRIRYK
jgi:peptide/nickel transport system permease protein